MSVLSSGWGAAQFSVVTVNSMSARTSFPAVGLGGLLGWVELVEGVKQKGRALTRASVCGFEDHFEQVTNRQLRQYKRAARGLAFSKFLKLKQFIRHRC